MLAKLTPVERRRPVHSGAVPFEDFVPVSNVTASCRTPPFNLLFVADYLMHVVAGPEPEIFQGELHGFRARPAKPGTDYFQPHSGVSILELGDSQDQELTADRFALSRV